MHYSPERWTDFVRNLTPPGEASLMRAHLDSGCKSCQKTVDWLNSIVAIVAAVPSFEDPPLPLIQQAKSAFRPLRLTPEWMEPFKPTLMAQLVHVSWGDWVSHGVRSGSANPERLLFRAGAYSIDLTIDHGVASTEPGEIVGQIVDEQGTANLGLLKGVLVQLCAGGRILGETEANQFGEFVLQRPGTRASRLRFALPIQGVKIELQLKVPKSSRRNEK